MMDIGLYSEEDKGKKIYWVSVSDPILEARDSGEVLLPIGRSHATAKSKAIRFLQKAIKQIEGME